MAVRVWCDFIGLFLNLAGGILLIVAFVAFTGGNDVVRPGPATSGTALADLMQGYLVLLHAGGGLLLMGAGSALWMLAEIHKQMSEKAK